MALTTLARLKSLIGLKDDDATNNVALAETIERVSAELSRKCGRRFEYEAEITEYHDGDGISRQLYTRRLPIVAVTTLHDDPNRVYGTGDLIAAADYVIDKESGLITLDGFAFATGLQNIKLVYGAGYQVIPQDLEEAALAIMAATFWDIHGELKTVIGEQVIERVASLRKRADEIVGRYIRWAL